MGSEAEEIPCESQGSTAQLWRMVSTTATTALTFCGHSFIAAEQIQAQPQLSFFFFFFLSSPPLFQAADRISNVCKRPTVFKCPSDTNWEREVCKWHGFMKTASCNTTAVGTNTNPPKEEERKNTSYFTKGFCTNVFKSGTSLSPLWSRGGHANIGTHYLGRGRNLLMNTIHTNQTGTSM